MSQSLTDAQVLEQVRRLVGKDRVRWTRHIQEQMEKRGLSKDQVKQCLRGGFFEEAPTVPNRPGEIEYAFRMAAVIDGQQIRVAASLLPDSHVVAITVFDADRNR
jgi:hypothetical protein